MTEIIIDKTAFFVDIDDISDIRKKINSGGIIFPLNFKSEKILRKNKIKTIIPDEFLKAEDYEKIDYN